VRRGVPPLAPLHSLSYAHCSRSPGPPRVSIFFCLDFGTHCVIRNTLNPAVSDPLASPPSLSDSTPTTPFLACTRPSRAGSTPHGR
jgi:hypothetical protein